MTTQDPQGTLRGVLASVAASALFGMIFYISGAVDATAETVVGMRILITMLCYGFVLLLPSARRAARDFLRSLRSSPIQPVIFVLLSALIGLQLWLFGWAPIHGHALDASLGYLLLPICLVLLGRFFFRHHVTRPQWIAVGIAIIAVLVKVLTSFQLSWVTIAISVGYAVYFGLRQMYHLDGPMAYGAEVLLLSPLAAFAMLSAAESLGPGTWWLIGAAGVAGAIAMAAYLAASGLLSMPVFGLLSYGEPLLLFVVSLLLGEALSPTDPIVYSLLAVALALLAIDGFNRGRKAL